MSAPRLRSLVRLAAALLAVAWTAAPAVAHATAQRAAAPAAGSVARVARPALDPWHTARALGDAARYDSALVVLRVALARAGDDVELRWLQAGITGESGRHHEAVALYERLMADHPGSAEQMRADLAAERLSADDPAGALRDLRRWLSDHPEDDDARRNLALALAQSGRLRPALAAYDSLLEASPEDTELALERARVLGWLGRHAQAIAAHQAILDRDSTVAAARLGVAMNENWQGRHRRAARRLESIARGRGVDPEVFKVLAFARYWDDDPDAARQALDQYGRRVTGDDEARELAGRIAREQRASLRIEGGRADDSDGLRVLSTGMELNWPLAHGTTGQVGWHRDNVTDADGAVDPLRLSAGLLTRLDAVWSAYGTYSHTDWGEGPGEATGGELGVVCRPVDGLRMEAAVSREPVLTRRSLALGISQLGWTAAVDLSPTERLTLHAAGREGLYSDHGRAERLAVVAQLRWFSGRRGELALTLGTEQLQAHADPDHGYYAPDFHREWGPGAEAEWYPGGQWTLGASGQVGRQQDKGEDATPFYSLGGHLEVAFARSLTFQLEGGGGDSSLQSAGGYRREWWKASLARGF